jgi:hypothetical protein
LVERFAELRSGRRPVRLNPVVWVPHGATTVPRSLGRLAVVAKDRESVHPIAGTEDAHIVYRRSNERPFEYAILLQIRTEHGWQTRAVADNSQVDRNVAEHSSITVTFDLYGHLMPGTEAKGAALLDAFLGEQEREPEGE